MVSRRKFKENLLKHKGDKGDYYCSWFGVETDWCAIFVSYAMSKIAGIDFITTARCSEMKRLNSKRVNHDFKTAEIGDIIFIENNGNPNDGADHVGIVIDNDVMTKTITLIEGNTKGNSSDVWYKTSSVNTYTYPYNSDKFDSIIDMSPYFEDDNTSYEELLEKIEKIKAIINS